MTTAKKRNILIFSMLGAILMLVLLYFFVILPLTAEEGENTDTPNVLEGEVLGSDNRILLFPHIERADIKSVEVHNTSGKYTIYKNSEDTFVLNGFESLSLDGTALSGVIVGAGYSLSMERIVDHCDNLSEYGLDDTQEPAWYRLTTTDGTVYSAYIGDKLLSGAAYYVRADGRDSVYAISNTLIEPLLAGKENLVSTQITSQVSSSTGALNVTDLAVFRGEEPLVAIKQLTDEEKESYGLDINYLMVEPAGYSVSVDTYSEALEQFSDFAATKILAVGITDAKLAKYGLDNYAKALYFKYNGEENMLLVSEPNAEGNYYVASVYMDVIAEMSGDKLAFIEYDLLHWVDQPIFMININEVASISIESDRVSETFTLTGEDKELVVTERDGSTPDVSNFRQFYKTLLSTEIQGYSELTDEQIAAFADTTPQLTFTYTTDAGKETVYRFYDVSERKTVYTVNGEGGEFYLLYTQVNKISSDCIRIQNGEQVNSEDRS